MNRKKMMAVSLTVAMTAGMLTGAASVSAADKTYTVGICQLVQHPALDAATKGFEDELKAELGDAVTFDEQNAAGDTATATTICQNLVSENVDLMRPPPFRARRRRRRKSRSSARRSRIMRPRWIWTISTVQSAAISPVHLTSRRLTSRLRCSASSFRTRRQSASCTAPRRRTPSIRRIRSPRIWRTRALR